MCSAHSWWVHCSQLMEQPCKSLAAVLLFSLFMRLACLVTSALMRKEWKDEDWRGWFPFRMFLFLDKVASRMYPRLCHSWLRELFTFRDTSKFFWNCVCSVLRYCITYWIVGRPCPSVYSVQSYLDNFYSYLCFLLNDLKATVVSTYMTVWVTMSIICETSKMEVQLMFKARLARVQELPKE